MSFYVTLPSDASTDSQAYIPPNVFGEFPMALMSETDPGRGNPPPTKGKRTNHWYVPYSYDNLRTNDQAWTDAEGHEGIPQFKWMKRGDQFDLLISNYREESGSAISDFAHHNYIDINIEMAQVFGL
ncbi:hypothetical protein OS493_007800 [Desmophyllum pertusum]|uniref:Uncharacterized protein n=1 Tax=Desmophyllum pertusum TaxID=174260 RepID=A0A9W9YS15_9CNID|nr:hypothetical protein OS493_007800 [Desmophyllum pertusum]